MKNESRTIILSNFFIPLFLCLGLFHLNCAIAPTHGLVYTNVSFPGEFNSENDVLVRRTAEGCQIHLLGLVSLGDASPGSIARRNEIRRIATIDHRFTGILFPVYGKYCTRIGGD